MKKYLLISPETLEKLLGCFTDDNEFQKFARELSSMIDEITFANQIALRNLEDQKIVTVMALRQLFMFGLFCKENIEIIHDLVRKTEFTEITEEEKRNIQDGIENEEMY